MNSTRREENDRDPALAAALAVTRQLHAATEELLDAAADTYGINRNDLRCLEILERDGGMQPGRLASAAGLSPAAVTKVLDRLEGVGYVSRSHEEGDRRTVRVRTSAWHARRRREIWRPVVDEATEVLSRLDSRERELVTTVLADLAAANRRSAAVQRDR